MDVPLTRTSPGAAKRLARTFLASAGSRRCGARTRASSLSALAQAMRMVSSRVL